jgi:hypothetical protein
MALNTDFNVSPYYDDYDEQKNFHRVLFRPAVPIQARELTQLQTILQAQVERFGDNIYRQGTIIKGCNLHFDNHYFYIKITDLQFDGQSVLVSSYANGIIKDSSNLVSSIVNYVQGLESQNPDLSTLYIKYTNTGTGNKKKYANGDLLTVYNKDYSIQSITIAAAGSGYSNSDTVTFLGGGGTGASANIVTYSGGAIRDVVINQAGSGYLTSPNVTITTSTGSSGALTALNYIAKVYVANSSFTNPVGVGTAISVNEGIIYQKGNFVRVGEQTTIVDKYSPSPNNVSLGFLTTESIVNSSLDSTLLDNAQGYSNYTAPGSHRLKLTANLIVVSTSNAQSNSDFFSILEYQDGQITKRKTETEFNSVSSELAKRTREESGNYVINPFTMYTEAITGNTSHLYLSVSSGIGYVDGYRAEIAGNIRIPLKKSKTFDTSNNQTISTNYGNYIVINELLGNFNYSSGLTVNLRTSAATDVTDNFGGTPTTNPGSLIGTASVKSLVYMSGTPGSPSCKYKIYLYNIVMSPGAKFSSVRSIQSTNGVADVVLEEGSAVLKETTYDSLIFSSGANAVSYFSNEQFIYRKAGAITLLTSGIGSVLLSGSEKFPYTVSSTLNDTQELDFIVVPTTNSASTTALTGTVSSSGNVITGSGTSFLVDLDVGDYVKFSVNTTYFRVTSITNATSMTVNGTTGPVVNATSNTLSYAFPAQVPIRFDRGSANISIDSTGNTASIFVGSAISNSAAATVYFNAKVDGANPKQKTVVKDVYIKLSTDKLLANTVGPWCLGIPDVIKIKGVYVGSSNTYSNTSTNYSTSFQLVDGQTDNIYGLSYIKKKPGSTLSLSATNCLLVRVDLFTHGSLYYLSTESYPVDDATNPLPSNKIRTEDIPYYISPKTKTYFNLRDSIDFRPIVANTANASATSVAGATVDPSSTEVISGTLYYPAPNQTFQADITYYLNRIDTVVLDAFSRVSLIEGKPSKNPVPPKVNDGAMLLGTVFVPPYPSLDPKSASQSKRPEYSTLVKTDQIRGYSMKDIKQIEDRINKLEYYSLLNTLEKSTTDLVIPSESNNTINRFKNGFFAESFSSYDISNVNSPEYAILIDTKSSIARPQLETTKINLNANTGASSNVTFTGEYGLLNYTDVLFLNQAIANRSRNLAQGGYEFYGNMKLFPRYDDFYDVDKGSVNVTIDLATPLNALTQSINDSVTFKKDIKPIVLSTSSAWNTVTAATTAHTGLQERTITTSTTTRTNTIDLKDVKTNVQQVGDFITDFGMKPYIRAQRITFAAVGLRPNTIHYVYFDKKNVSAFCQPGTITNVNNIADTGYADTPSFKITGAKGAELRTSDTGQLVGVFYLPEETFYCGDREFIISDSDVTDLESALSSATSTFNAFNFYKDSSSFSISTKTPGKIIANSTDTTAVIKTPDSRVTPRLNPPAPQCCCFVAGTQILMADGSTKNIEDVALGEIVVGKDGVRNTVLKFLRPKLGETGATLMAFNNGKPFMASDHPVYVRGQGWKSFDPAMTYSKYSMTVGQYQVGDVVETVDGLGFKIHSIEEYSDQDPNQTIYNFVLDGNNTYIADNLVVHNKGGGAGGGGGCVPIAQTFKIDSTEGSDGVFLTKMKLWFKQKDPTQHITISIRDTSAGYPASTVIFEQVVNNSNINVSNNASVATEVTFQTPVYLKAGTEYSFIVVPGNHSPEFLIWTAETGVPDVTTPALLSNKNWGGGVMFLSTNDTVYTPYQTEDIKFEIYIASFNKTDGVAVFNNDTYEFLTVSGTSGAFKADEELAQKSNTYLTGTFTCNTSSAVVNTSTSQVGLLSTGDYVLITYASNNTLTSRTGTISANTTSPQINGTSSVFTSEYVAGDLLIINGDVRTVNSVTNNTILILDAPLNTTVTSNVHRGVADKIYQISRVNSVNSAAVVLKDTPSTIIDGGLTYYGAVQKVVRAVIDNVGKNNNLVLNKSNAANSIFLFQAGKRIVGETSQATATIASVDNKTVNFTESYLRFISPTSTSVSLVEQIDNANTSITITANNIIKEGVSNQSLYNAAIKSRSNEIISGSKSLSIYVNLNRTGEQKYVSPYIDISPASAVVMENIINNDSSNETTGYGSAKVRYVSKNVVLAEGLDAEDIKVYITAFKPVSTDILVYAKILASDDTESIDSKGWSLLNQVTESNLYSDSLNQQNYLEYEYGFKQTPPVLSLDGKITTYGNSTVSNTTVTGVGTTFNSSLVVGDIIKLVQTDTLIGYDIAVVNSVANSTSLTITTNTSSAFEGYIEKVTQKNAAFKYYRESNLVNYFDNAYGRHTSYKVFAIKVVLLSSSPNLVPTMKDIRALAVSI